MWLPEWNELTAVFMAFRNAFSSVGGSPLLRNAAGFHGISKHDKEGARLRGRDAERRRATHPRSEKGVSEQQEAFRSSKNRIRCKGVCGGLHRSESGAVFTAFRNAFRWGWGTCVVQNGRAPCNSFAASLRRKPGERGHRSIM